MRTFKFRTWDKRNKCMYYGDTAIHFSTDSALICVGMFDTNYTWEVIEDDLEIMQWTGLQDCKGKDIYEGDIVKIKADYGGDYYYKDDIGIVEYEEDGFIVSGLINEYIQQDYSWRDVEIIGNQFENNIDEVIKMWEIILK